MNLTRRHFIRNTAALGAATGLGISPTISAQGTTLNVRMRRDIAVLDPGYMVGGTEVSTQAAVMPRLARQVTHGDTLIWIPSDYVSSVVQTDPTHIDFTLKPGFMWTNGFGELTSADVKYSFERMLESEWSGNWESLETVEVKDKYSGTIVLNRAFAPFATITLAGSTGIMVCKAATEEVGGKYAAEIPATCGPYINEWTPKQRTVFKLNPDWAGPKPYFDQINYIVVDEDKVAELAYEAGEVELTEIAANTVLRYAKNPPENSTVVASNSLQYAWVGLNTEHPKLKDPRVRKAIQHAVDVKSILQGAYNGVTHPSYGPVPPGLVGKRSETNYAYDPAKAKALLSEAGVSGLELSLRTMNAQDRMLAAQIVQANLLAVGIKLEIIPLEAGPFWDMGQESKGDVWKDLELWIMRYGASPDPYSVMQWFVRSQVGIWNWERWSSDEFEDLYAKGLVETDVDARHSIYIRMQEIMEDTGGYVWLTHEPESFVHSNDLVPEIGPSGNLDFRNFKRV